MPSTIATAQASLVATAITTGITAEHTIVRLLSETSDGTAAASSTAALVLNTRDLGAGMMMMMELSVVYMFSTADTSLTTRSCDIKRQTQSSSCTCLRSCRHRTSWSHRSSMAPMDEDTFSQ